MGPRDAISRLAVPVDPLTGEALSDAQLARIDKLTTAYNVLKLVMHECDGSSGEGFGTRSMSIAATQMELGILMAYRAALESR